LCEDNPATSRAPDGLARLAAFCPGNRFVRPAARADPVQLVMAEFSTADITALHSRSVFCCAPRWFSQLPGAWAAFGAESVLSIP
jgi:hypothetical protein